MKTEIKTVQGVEYLCEPTSKIKEGDMIIKSFNPIDKPTEISLNVVTFINTKANIFKYEKVSGDGRHSFGLGTFRSMIDLSKYINRKMSVELDTLHLKVIKQVDEGMKYQIVKKQGSGNCEILGEKLELSEAISHLRKTNRFLIEENLQKPEGERVIVTRIINLNTRYSFPSFMVADMKNHETIYQIEEDLFSNKPKI